MTDPDTYREAASLALHLLASGDTIGAQRALQEALGPRCDPPPDRPGLDIAALEVAAEVHGMPAKLRHVAAHSHDPIAATWLQYAATMITATRQVLDAVQRECTDLEPPEYTVSEMSAGCWSYKLHGDREWCCDGTIEGKPRSRASALREAWASQGRRDAERAGLSFGSTSLGGIIIDCDVNSTDLYLQHGIEDKLKLAREFWSAALKLSIKDPDEHGEHRYAVLASDRVAIEVQMQNDRTGVHLDLAADDVDEEVERLKVLGARVIEAHPRGWVIMRTPTGHSVCVTQRKPLAYFGKLHPVRTLEPYRLAHAVENILLAADERSIEGGCTEHCCLHRQPSLLDKIRAESAKVGACVNVDEVQWIERLDGCCKLCERPCPLGGGTLTRCGDGWVCQICLEEKVVAPEVEADGARVHHLRTWPAMFAAVKAGEKHAEVRRDDRDYRVGDFLELEEYDPAAGVRSGASVRVQVTHAFRESQFGVIKGHVMLSFVRVEDPMVAVLKAAEAAKDRGWPRTIAVMETRLGNTATISVGEPMESDSIRDALHKTLRPEDEDDAPPLCSGCDDPDCPHRIEFPCIGCDDSDCPDSDEHVSWQHHELQPPPTTLITALDTDRGEIVQIEQGTIDEHPAIRVTERGEPGLVMTTSDGDVVLTIICDDLNGCPEVHILDVLPWLLEHVRKCRHNMDGPIVANPRASQAAIDFVYAGLRLFSRKCTSCDGSGVNESEQAIDPECDGCAGLGFRLDLDELYTRTTEGQKQ